MGLVESADVGASPQIQLLYMVQHVYNYYLQEQLLPKLRRVVDVSVNARLPLESPRLCSADYATCALRFTWQEVYCVHISMFTRHALMHETLCGCRKFQNVRRQLFLLKGHVDFALDVPW